MSNIENIINGELDLYDYLQIDDKADPSTIRRSYRRIALKHHPDKNSDLESVHTFQLVSQIYEILSNQELRTTYDEIRRNRQFKQSKEAELDDRTRAFKEQLLNKERDLNSTGVFNNVSARELEKLKEDGLKRRRNLESKSYNNRNAYVSYRDLAINPIFDITDNSEKSTKVILKWKNRPELKGKLTLDIIKDIMTVFGPIEAIQQIPDIDKYNAAIIEFSNSDNVDRAITHDYRKSASLWDGTPYRKLASLLRECTIYKPIFSNEQLKESNISLEFLTDNNIINDVMIKRINQEMSKSYST